MSTMQVKLQSQTETESAASCASVPATTSAPEFHRERSEAASITSMNWNASMKSLTKLRAMLRAGEHLHGCFASVEKRAEGWKMMMTAKRAAKRLGIAGLL